MLFESSLFWVMYNQWLKAISGSAECGAPGYLDLSVPKRHMCAGVCPALRQTAQAPRVRRGMPNIEAGAQAPRVSRRCAQHWDNRSASRVRRGVLTTEAGAQAPCVRWDVPSIEA